jgi:hypothetical protein
MTLRDYIRIHVAVAATFMLVGCYTVRYEYVELSGEHIAVANVARPNGDGVGLGKGKIPARYALEAPGASLTFDVDYDGGRSILITSSVPIVSVSTTVGQSDRVSTFKYRVGWAWAFSASESHAGETLEIRIELEQRADPIVVSGVIEKWGKFYRYPDIM